MQVDRFVTHRIHPILNVSFTFVYSSNEVSWHDFVYFKRKTKRKKKIKKEKKRKEREGDSRYIFSDRAMRRVVFSSA